MQNLGAIINLDDGYIKASAPQGKRLLGGHIIMDKVSVTGTENLMMAATLADGETIIDNAALEPEVVDWLFAYVVWELRLKVMAALVLLLRA